MIYIHTSETSLHRLQQPLSLIFIPGCRHRRQPPRIHQSSLPRDPTSYPKRHPVSTSLHPFGVAKIVHGIPLSAPLHHPHLRRLREVRNSLNPCNPFFSVFLLSTFKLNYLLFPLTPWFYVAEVLLDLSSLFTFTDQLFICAESFLDTLFLTDIPRFDDFINVIYAFPVFLNVGYTHVSNGHL